MAYKILVKFLSRFEMVSLDIFDGLWQLTIG